MATRVEKAIAYHLLRKVYFENTFLAYAAQVFQKLEPVIGGPLRMSLPVDALETEEPPLADTDFVKSESERYCVAVQQNHYIVSQFMTRYPTTMDIENGLADWGKDASLLLNNSVTSNTHATNGIASAQLQTTDLQLSQTGALLALYKPYIDIKEPPQSKFTPLEKGINIFQDILNAMAIELTGVCSHSGVNKYTKAKDIKTVVESRITTANRVWVSTPRTPETLNMKSVLDYVIANIESANTLSTLTTLGSYIDANVEQLPLVRRWWRL